MKPRLKVIVLMVVSLLVSAVLSPLAMARDLEQQSSFATPILVVNTSFLNVRTGPGVEYTVLVTVVGGTELSVLARSRDNVWYQVATDKGAGWVNVEFTLPRGSFANVPLKTAEENLSELGQGGGGEVSSNVGTAVTTSSAVRLFGLQFFGGDIWQEPRYDSLVLRSGVPGDENLLHPLLNEVRDANGGQWYSINYPGVGVGWVNQGVLRLLSCGVNQVYVTTGEHFIRFDGIANRSGYRMTTGTEMYVRGRQNGFSVVELADSTIGLVVPEDIVIRTGVTSLCEYLPASSAASQGQGGGGETSSSAPVQPRLAVPVAIVNTGNLNVRSGPNVGFSAVAVVAGGTSLEVVGRANDNVWLLVEGDFGRGWVNIEFVLFRGVYDSVPVVNANDVIIQSNQTNPNANLGQGGGGATSTVVSSTSPARLFGVQFFGGDIWQEPRYDSLVLRSGVAGDENLLHPLLNEVKDANGGTWYLINYPGLGVGWVNQGILRLLSCGVNQVYVTTGEHFIRFDGIANRSGYRMTTGTEMYVRGRQNGFSVVELADSTIGLVVPEDIVLRTGVTSLCDYLPAPSSSIASLGQGGGGDSTPVTSTNVVTGNRVVVNTGNLNVRSGPSAGFSVVATVSGGTTLAVVGRAKDNVWFLVEGSFGRGWINIEFGLFRGSYDTVPVVDF